MRKDNNGNRSFVGHFNIEATTFMRRKDNLKSTRAFANPILPAYNIQITTRSSIICQY